MGQRSAGRRLQGKPSSSGATSDHGSESKSRPVRSISKFIEEVADTINNLPYFVLIAFYFLAPTVTNNGDCDPVRRCMTFGFLCVLCFFCCFASLVDSVRGPDGQVYYGIATLKDIFLFDCPDPAGSGLTDLSNYRIRVKDVYHAVSSVAVFGAFAMSNNNVLNCVYPPPQHHILKGLPIVPPIAVLTLWWLRRADVCK